jgi:hypothetical protein
LSYYSRNLNYLLFINGKYYISFNVVELAGYLTLGYSTPFLSIGSSFMYASLSAAKAAVLQAGEEIRTHGLPIQISPLVFIFTGSGNGKKQGKFYLKFNDSDDTC